MNSNNTSMSPSTSGTSRYMLHNPKVSLHHQIIQNKWLELHAQRSQPINYMQRNIMTPNITCDVSSNPCATSGIIIGVVDVKEYKLEDLIIRIENDFIVIRGSHGEKRDEYSLISRKFTRRVAIPKNVAEDEIEIQLLPNGILSITANKQPKTYEIPIIQTDRTKLELQKNHWEEQRMGDEEHSTPVNLDETQPIDLN